MAKNTDWGTVAIAGAIIYGISQLKDFKLPSLNVPNLNPFNRTAPAQYSAGPSGVARLPEGTDFRVGDTIREDDPGFREISSTYKRGDRILTRSGSGTVVGRDSSTGAVQFVEGGPENLYKGGQTPTPLKGATWKVTPKALSTTQEKKDNVTKNPASGRRSSSRSPPPPPKRWKVKKTPYTNERARREKTASFQ